MTDTLATQDDAQSDDAQLQVQVPGEQLRKARELMGLSTQDVSDKLNLKHSFVQMIEEDNYASLPGSTFIRGYLRAYAKLVGIESESLVDSYNANFNEEPKPEERYKPIETIKPQRSFSDPLIKYTTLAVTASLIALSIMWWQSRNGAETIDLAQSDTVTVETSEGETVIAPMDLSDAEENLVLDPETIVEESVDGSVSDSTDPSQDNTDVELAEDNPVEAVSVTSDEPKPEEVEQSAMVLERFTIVYTDECWVEVTDGRGIKIVSNLKKKGEESIVEGLPPFKLMIGNADAARVNYQGAEVDLSSYSNENNIARFTLGE